MTNEWLQPEGQKLSRSKREIFDWVDAAAVALAAVVLLFTFIFRLVGVDGSSMAPTLINGDRVITSHLFYTPSGGDIVVITQPNVFDRPIIKRIIAVGGQTVDIDYSTSTVYVDGEPLDEPYIMEDMLPAGDVSLPLTVPEGYVFVLGDNRNASSDSRSSGIGLIDEHYILGRAIFRIWPLGSIGGVN